MPTPTLHLLSPFEKLFGSAPNYHKLRVFRCLCYPWLHPYSQHKLDSHSTPCVFLRYSSTQSAYICLDPSTSKTYISRHVKFLENSFPFTTHQSHLSRTTPEIISKWLPPVQILPISRGSLNTSPQRNSSCQHPSQHTQTVDQPSSLVDYQPLSSNLLLLEHISVDRLPLESHNSETSSTSTVAQPTHQSIHPMLTRVKNNIHKPLT